MSICLAQLVHNAKILLIDSDMRCSRVNRLLIDDETENRGLSEYLAGLDAEPYIRRLRDADNLYVMGAGAKSPNPAGLLASNKMKDLIARLENEYDYIIIDTPPIGIVTDALLYSTYVTGYILSCRADYSNINLVKETITSIREVSGNVLGVILNSLNPKLSKRRGHYGYDSYMGYDTYKNSADN
jgi:capsular exopolysaccharide synthesis family protein